MDNPMTDARVFTREAMNTTFSLRIRGLDIQSADGMASECFDQLEQMENHLSRFIPSSDVSRINRLAAGDTLYLSETCHQCLLESLDAHVRTGGLFDITLGARIAQRKSGESASDSGTTGRLIIHPDTPAVTCEEPGRQIDLGGIGKGFALDRLKVTLIDWGAEDFLLAAGASSLLAYGPSEWPIELPGDVQTVKLALLDGSLSTSGTRIQGSHIVHPAGDVAMPSDPCDRIWVHAPTATLAEIWSTALMLLPMEEIADFLGEDSGVLAVHAERGGRILEVFRSAG